MIELEMYEEFGDIEEDEEEEETQEEAVERINMDLVEKCDEQMLEIENVLVGSFEVCSEITYCATTWYTLQLTSAPNNKNKSEHSIGNYDRWQRKFITTCVRN